MRPNLIPNQPRQGRGHRRAPALSTALIGDLKEALSLSDPKTPEGRRLAAMRATLAISNHSPNVTKEGVQQLYQKLSPKGGEQTQPE